MADANEAHNIPLPPDAPDIPARVMQDSFYQLQMEMRAQNLVKQIRDYAGEGSRRFRDWLRDVERVGAVLGANDERYKLLALQTLKGIAGDYASRIFREAPGMTWDQMRGHLVQNFSEEADGLIALQKLHKLKQGKGETAQSFIEKIRNTAEEAYLGHEMANPLIQRQLIDTLAGGIYDKSTARRLMRERPRTFDRAVEITLNEQQTSKAFNLRRGEEDMEVDVIGEAKPDDRLERLMDRLEALVVTPERPKGGRVNHTPKRFKWTKDGKPICDYCSKIGHVQRDCHKKKRDSKSEN